MHSWVDFPFGTNWSGESSSCIIKNGNGPIRLLRFSSQDHSSRSSPADKNHQHQLVAFALFQTNKSMSDLAEILLTMCNEMGGSDPHSFSHLIGHPNKSTHIHLARWSPFASSSTYNMHFYSCKLFYWRHDAAAARRSHYIRERRTQRHIAQPGPLL